LVVVISCFVDESAFMWSDAVLCCLQQESRLWAGRRHDMPSCSSCKLMLYCQLSCSLHFYARKQVLL